MLEVDYLPKHHVAAVYISLLPPSLLQSQEFQHD